MKIHNTNDIKSFLKAFVLSSIVIILLAGLALADTGTKEVAGYMGDKALEFSATADTFTINFFENSWDIKIPAFIQNAGNIITHLVNSLKGILGLLKFLYFSQL